MCRAGGRRCPGQYDPAKAAARNAKRRAQRAAAKAAVTDNGGGAGAASPNTKEVSGKQAAQGAEIARAHRKRFMAEEQEKFPPLTELKINNPNLPPMTAEAIYELEDVAVILESDGEQEAANIVRFAGREVASLDNPVRADVMRSYYARRAVLTHLEGKEKLRDAYAQMEQFVIATSYGLSEDGRDRYLGAEEMAQLHGTFRSGSLPDSSLSVNAMAEQYEENLKLREKARILGEPTARFSAGSGGDSYTAKEILEGRRESGEEIPGEEYRDLSLQVSRAMAEHSSALMGAIAKKDGSAPSQPRLNDWGEYEEPREGEENLGENGDDGATYRGEELPGAPGFVRLGHGAEHSVYFHQPTGLVYKVPWENNLVAQRNADMDPEKLNQLTQEAYAMVDERALEQHGVENIKTAFVDAKVGERTHHLLVQPFYNPSEWEGISLSRVAQSKLLNMGVSDLHAGNVKVNMETGEVRLLDCLVLPRGDDESDFSDW